MARVLFIFNFLAFSLSAQAKKIQFPEEELASESVLPVFDTASAVRGRNVSLEDSIEIGLFGGALLTEALYRQYSVGLTASFHTSEHHGWNFAYQQWLEGETSYREQLENDESLGINLEGAPELESMALFSYQYSPWYGKISLTKQTVANLHLFLLAGGGIAVIGGEVNPALSLGLGQKFYLTKNLALRFDLRGMFYRGPDTLSLIIPEGGPVPETSEFEKKWFTQTLLSTGLVFLF